MKVCIYIYASEFPSFQLVDIFIFFCVDMFRALDKFDLQSDHVFTVTVGASSKQTAAHWHLLEPADVISTIGILNGSVHPQDC